MRRRNTSVARRLALAVSVIIVAGCGTIQPSAEGSVSGEDVTAIQALVRTRAEAIGKGDLQAFLGTIDPARPALRRTQQQEFADPNGRIQPGALVHFQQPLFSLPDLTRMQVKVKILKRGMRAPII